jgi:16S rRNA pseudouridine516 synthase
MGSPHRIDQLLSRCGYCSRAEARRWIAAGRLRVNGVPAVGPDQKADPHSVRVDGEPLDHPDGLTLLLHKPAGCVCSHDVSEGPTVYDGLPERWRRRHPPLTSVGRLDRDTTGALVLTDDGALVHRWTSPRHHVVKCYEVTLDGAIGPGLMERFAAGTMKLDGETRPCRPARLEITGPREARLELVEGRYHQVKRMFASVGLQVLRLHRSRFGSLEVAGLMPGEWRVLSAESLQGP